MNKFVVTALLVALCGTVTLADKLPVAGDEEPPASAPVEDKCPSNVYLADDMLEKMDNSCLDAVRKQIQLEVDASYVYMTAAAHFSRDDVNMPGFAAFFFEHAGEERSHALGLIEYLLMRGPKGSDQSLTKNLITVKRPVKDLAGQNSERVQVIPDWTNGLQALEAALAKEKEVTASIKGVIKICDGDGKNTDYHLSDHLTGEFLEEQYRGMRDLAGKIATLKKMEAKSGALGLFLFDKELSAH